MAAIPDEDARPILIGTPECIAARVAEYARRNNMPVLAITVMSETLNSR